MADWVHVPNQPGVYKNTKTGQVLKGQAKDPNSNPKLNTVTTKPGQSAKPAVTPQLPYQTNPELKDATSVAAKVNYTNPGSVVAGQTKIASDVYKVNQEGGNPDVNGPLGSRHVTYDPVTGQPTIDDQLTGNNADLYGAESNADIAGANASQKFIQGLPQNPYDPNSVSQGIPQYDQGARQQSQDAAYGQLTQGVEDNYKRDYESKKQELADRGIPVGSAQFDDQMKQLDTRYDQVRADARQKAVGTGNQELHDSFGMGLQAHQQGLSDYQSSYALPLAWGNSALSMGQGYQNPNFQPYQAPTMQTPDLGGPYGTTLNNKTQNRQISTNASIDAQKIALARSKGGGKKASAGPGTAPDSGGPTPGE